MLAAAAGLTAASLAHGADWRVDPTMEVGVMSDSNLRLTEGADRVDVAGGFANAQLEFRAATPLALFSFTPRLEVTHFPKAGDRDEDYVNGGARALWMRRWRTGLSRMQAEFDDSATVSGNRARPSPEDGELGNPDDPADSGSLVTDNRMRTISLRESLRFDLAERDALEVSAGYLDRKFDEQSVLDDVSFTALNGNLGWMRQLRERASLGLRLRAMRFDPELIPLTTTSVGLEGEWRYRVSERVQSYVRAGASRTRYKASTGPEPDAETAFVGGVGGSWQLRMSQVFLDATRSIDPNSSGVTVARTQLRLRLDRDFSPRARGSLAVRVIDDDGPAGFNERRYGVASVGAEWRFTQAWSLVGRYDYTWQNYRLTPGSASSNAVRLSVSWQPRREARNDASLFE